ncbi:MAG: FtsX-like permease family protein [Bacteroidales bacterium]|nr:FtsX-like permease family protein [Bacteroidales bacterium]
MKSMFEEIISSLRRNKMRTALTGFAVAWGIFMLIVLLGAGNGLVHAFEADSSKQAMNAMNVTPGWTSIEYKGLKTNRRIRLNEADMDELKRKFDDKIIDILPTVGVGGMKVSYGQEYVSASLNGVYPDFPNVRRIELSKGRFINQIDINEERKVCVLGNKTVDVLFPNDEPTGKFVKVNDLYYKVIGVYTDDNTWGTQDVLVPFSTLSTIYMKEGYINRMTMTTKNLTSIEDNEAFETDVRTLLGKRRNFDKDDTNAVWIWNRMTQYLQVNGALSILKTAIWVIGILTLISGIVGVSNIMLITVKERTHEFGIRKALGAKPRQILVLIVTESIAITALFGYIGMVAGVGATELINMIVEQMDSEAFRDPTVDIKIAIEATLTLIVAGTMAGFFPAKRAVSIKPIEALREQ